MGIVNDIFINILLIYLEFKVIFFLVGDLFEIEIVYFFIKFIMLNFLKFEESILINKKN